MSPNRCQPCPRSEHKDGEPIFNISAYAMNGWFFDIQSGEDWRPFATQAALTLQEVHQSWRSNTIAPAAT